MKGIISVFLLFLISFLYSCSSNEKVEEINIGYIGPLTGNAQDLGADPAKAIQLAIDDYNRYKKETDPKVNLFIENDFWKGEKAVPLYDRLRQEHQIKILLISHSDGTISLQKKVKKDGVILINPLNNDALLSKMNENTFLIGKKTEEAAQVIAARIIELGLKKITGFHVDNTFMSIFSEVVKKELKQQNIHTNIIKVGIDQTDYKEELTKIGNKNTDGMVFFGYKNLGFAMKQAREMNINAQFFGATTTLGKGFYENSEGTIVGTEISFFTPNDGNYVLGMKFLNRFKSKYGYMPSSVWPPLQAYDAINIVLDILKKKKEMSKGDVFDEWFKNKLHETKFHQGVCGNVAILEDGSSRGIYFSLYSIVGHNEIEKVKR